MSERKRNILRGLSIFFMVGAVLICLATIIYNLWMGAYDAAAFMLLWMWFLIWAYLKIMRAIDE